MIYCTNDEVSILFEILSLLLPKTLIGIYCVENTEDSLE